MFDLATVKHVEYVGITETDFLNFLLANDWLLLAIPQIRDDEWQRSYYVVGATEEILNRNSYKELHKQFFDKRSFGN